MRFLLDACAASRSLHSMLLADGHDVASALDIDPMAADSALLALASAQERILITEDKDFGELVFVRRQPHAGIIRFASMAVHEKVDAMRHLLEQYSTELRAGCIIVVTRNRIRIRQST